MADAPETLRELQRDLKKALRLMESKAEDYAEARDYYDGTHAEVSASKVVRKMLKESAQSMPVSLAHIPVDAVIEKVNYSGLTATEAQPAAVLAEVADANDLEGEIDEWLTKAGYFGDYYVVVDPSTETEDGEPTSDGIRWVGTSPLSSIVVYDKRDERLARYGVKVWRDDDAHALLYYDDCTVALVAPKSSTMNADMFELDIADGADEGDAYVFHDGGAMLIRHLAIGGRPYGVPLHQKAWGPQDAITKISAINLSNVDGQGFASRWALLDPAAEIDDDIDDDFGTDAPGTSADRADGLTRATTGESRIRTVPGAISLLRGVKQVGQFSETNSDDFLKNLDWYVRVMAVATGVALFEFDLTGQQPSGESRRRAESRSIRKAERIKRTAGEFLKNLGDVTLGVLGLTGTVTASFKPSEMATDKEGLELVSAKVSAGVPLRVALVEAGYTSELVDDWYPSDAPALSPELLTALAGALQQLGSAKTLGVLTDADLVAMLPELISSARDEGPIVDAPEVLDDPLLDEVVTDPAVQLKAQADALGILIRAGADPEEAAAKVGLEGLTFPNVPVTVRLPEGSAAQLEEK
jgi:hypothetical protein